MLHSRAALSDSDKRRTIAIVTDILGHWQRPEFVYRERYASTNEVEKCEVQIRSRFMYRLWNMHRIKNISPG